MANTKHIMEQIEGFYAGSIRLTPVYWEEIFNVFAALSDDDFDICLQKHRKSTEAQWPPAGPAMVSNRLAKHQFTTISKICDCGQPAGLRGRCEGCIEKNKTRAKKYAKRFKQERLSRNN